MAVYLTVYEIFSVIVQRDLENRVVLKVVYDLSNGAIFNDFERFQGHANQPINQSENDTRWNGRPVGSCINQSIRKGLK